MDFRHPASQRVSKWGLVHGWLAQDAGRRVEMRAAIDGFVVSVEDPELGTLAASVDVDEDPSSAIWRSITRLTTAPR